MRAFEKIIGLTIVSAMGLVSWACTAPVSSSEVLEGSRLPSGAIHVANAADVASASAGGWADLVRTKGVKMFGPSGGMLSTSMLQDEQYLVGNATGATTLTAAQRTNVINALSAALALPAQIAPSFPIYTLVCHPTGASTGTGQTCAEQQTGTGTPSANTVYLDTVVAETTAPSSWPLATGMSGMSGGTYYQPEAWPQYPVAFFGGIDMQNVIPALGYLFGNGLTAARQDGSTDPDTIINQKGDIYLLAEMPVGSASAGTSAVAATYANIASYCNTFLNAYSAYFGSVAGVICTSAVTGDGNISVLFGTDPPPTFHI